METLLEKARNIKTHQRKISEKYSEEDLDLVLAWMRGEINSAQISKARGSMTATGSCLYYCSSVIKKFYAEGKLRVEKF